MTLISPLSSPGSGAAHGSGMDRKIERKPWQKHGKAIGAGAATLVALITAYLVFVPSSARSVKVDNSTVSVAAATRGAFEDFVPVRGRVTPLKTVFLDAMEGGRVEKLYVEDGADVKAGDVLVDLSNTSLQLEVLQRETEVAQQANNMRSLELSLEQSRLDHRRDLVDADYQIQRLGRNLERRRKLFTTGVGSPGTELEFAL